MEIDEICFVTESFLTQSLDVATAPGNKNGNKEQKDKHARWNTNNDGNLVDINGPNANHPSPIEWWNHAVVILDKTYNTYNIDTPFLIIFS